jgi:hypothetical protein
MKVVRRSVMPRKKSVGASAAKPEPAPAKKAAAPKPAAKAKAAVLVIDYPQEGEIVTSASYTFRVTAHRPRAVEVSLDGKTWRAARECVGHWWYDWTGSQSGPCTLVARMTDASGKTVKTKPRQFTVLI